MVGRKGKGLSLTIHMACELKRLWSQVCAVLFPACPTSGEVVLFPGLSIAIQFDSRKTKKASSKEFPAFHTIPESIDSFP